MTKLIGDFHEEKISSYIRSSLPDFTWEITGIKKIVQKESRLISSSFELIGYQVKGHVEIEIDSSYLYVNLLIEEQDFELLQVKPTVTYILKDLSGKKRYLIRRDDVSTAKTPFKNFIRFLIPSLSQNVTFINASLLKKYIMNDSITLDIHIFYPIFYPIMRYKMMVLL
ncbi:hypothetical protein CHUAL_013641 [Chamberlinius hualienensis]